MTDTNRYSISITESGAESKIANLGSRIHRNWNQSRKIESRILILGRGGAEANGQGLVEALDVRVR